MIKGVLRRIKLSLLLPEFTPEKHQARKYSVASTTSSPRIARRPNTCEDFIPLFWSLAWILTVWSLETIEILWQESTSIDSGSIQSLNSIPRYALSKTWCSKSRKKTNDKSGSSVIYMATQRRKIHFSMVATPQPMEDFWVGPSSGFCLVSLLKKVICLTTRTAGSVLNHTKLVRRGLLPGSNSKLLILSPWKIAFTAMILVRISVRYINQKTTKTSEWNLQSLFMKCISFGNKSEENSKLHMVGSSLVH